MTLAAQLATAGTPQCRNAIDTSATATSEPTAICQRLSSQCNDRRAALQAERIARLIDRIVVVRFEHAAIRQRNAARDVADALGDLYFGERKREGHGSAVHVHGAVGAKLESGFDARCAPPVEVLAADQTGYIPKSTSKKSPTSSPIASIPSPELAVNAARLPSESMAVFSSW